MLSAALNSYIEPVFIFKSRLISTYIRKSLLWHAILLIFKQTKKNCVKQTNINWYAKISKQNIFQGKGAQPVAYNYTKYKKIKNMLARCYYSTYFTALITYHQQ